jgi:hypothetical protein
MGAEVDLITDPSSQPIKADEPRGREPRNVDGVRSRDAVSSRSFGAEHGLADCNSGSG